uniref:Uncharacterized protein n=1 Tax=Glossina palpalis gambiensis TaxID=67801 RepID=A0A1B0BEZ3_9MUSC
MLYVVTDCQYIVNEINKPLSVQFLHSVLPSTSGALLNLQFLKINSKNLGDVLGRQSTSLQSTFTKTRLKVNPYDSV